MKTNGIHSVWREVDKGMTDNYTARPSPEAGRLCCKVMFFTLTFGDEPGFLIYIISRMDAFPDGDPRT